MLRRLRGHIQSWILKAILIFVALTFIGWGAGYLGQTKKEHETVAEVYHKKISYGELQTRVRFLEDFYKNISEDTGLEDISKTLNLKEIALKDLIGKYLLLYKAEKEGLVVTKEEMIDSIMTNPLFLTNGRFDQRKYRFLLSRNRLTPEEFEATQKNEILIKKMENLIKDNVKVSKKELIDTFKRENQEIRIGYILLEPSYFKNKIDVSQKDINEFYNKNRERYREPEKRKVRYILVNSQNFMKDIQIKEPEIEEYYTDRLEEYSIPKKIWVKHILIKVPPELSEKEARRKMAEMIAQRLKKGEAFSKLAKKYSEDASAIKGGDLGYLTRENMIQELQKPVFTLKKGEISGVIKTPIGYHIVKAEDIQEAHTRELKDVRDDIKKKLTKREADFLAEDRANEILEEIIKSGDDLQETAKKYSLFVKTTGFFQKDMEKSELKEIKDSADLAKTAFFLRLGEISDVIRLGDGYCILKLVDIKESYIPSQESIKQRMVTDIKKQKMLSAAFEKGEEILAELQANKGLKEIAKRLRLKREVSKYFSRITGLSEIEMDINSLNKVFTLKKGESTVVKTKDGAYIIRLIGKKDIDLDGFKEAKPELSLRLLAEKQNKVFGSWFQNELLLAYQKGVIKENRELLKN